MKISPGKNFQLYSHGIIVDTLTFLKWEHRSLLITTIDTTFKEVADISKSLILSREFLLHQSSSVVSTSDALTL